MDAGHAAWFRAMFGHFVTAMDDKEYVGRPAMDALRCIELLNTAYESAADGCRERRIPHFG